MAAMINTRAMEISISSNEKAFLRFLEIKFTRDYERNIDITCVDLHDLCKSQSVAQLEGGGRTGPLHLVKRKTPRALKNQLMTPSMRKEVLLSSNPLLHFMEERRFISSVSAFRE